MNRKRIARRIGATYFPRSQRNRELHVGREKYHWIVHEVDSDPGKVDVTAPRGRGSLERLPQKEEVREWGEQAGLHVRKAWKRKGSWKEAGFCRILSSPLGGGRGSKAHWQRETREGKDQGSKVSGGAGRNGFKGQCSWSSCH